MGAVYEAEDLRLGRKVAIKFLKEHEPEREARFLREARTQASVEHEHICKVYEVGETDGKPFIVMQLINGQPLGLAAQQMTLEQKLLTVQKAAEALHEAHRAGLVHRDLKPSNIMVEQTSAGGFKPYVMDFGLAFMDAAGDLTVTGEILGTPGYMAPEQVRGETNLDRRTDVYGLGATLYRLLVDRAPFGKSSAGAALVDILAKEPTKPRTIEPGIPRDVETMVMKCLEKQREYRYDSALALAEDLDRYLNGEPILARRATWLEIAGKKLRKHKKATFGATAALLLLALSLGWGAWRTAVEARLARALTGEVKEIEAIARYAYLSRRHDIRPVHQSLRQRMDSIRQVMAGHGKRARGPGAYALGWGYLALGQPDAARRHLDEAWQAGFREPAAAYALGLAYSALYRERLEAARLSGDGQERTRLEAAARTELRDPALAYMRQAQSFEGAAPEYLSALIAYCEDRFQDALPLLEEARRNMPWLYEAHRLEADLFRDWARSESLAGRSEQARAYFTRALAAYDAATRVGQSDPETYKAMTRALLGMMHMDMFEGGELSAYLDHGLETLALSLEVLPNDSEALLLEARLRHNAAQRLRLDGLDPTADLAAGLGAVQRALAQGADPAQAHLEQGALLWAWARWLIGRKEPAETMVVDAVEALTKVTPESRDYRYFFYLGSAYKSLAEARVRRGLDGRGDYRCAIEAYRQAVRLEPERLEALNSLALGLYHLSSQEDETPIPLLREAVDCLKRATALNPNHVVLRYQLGRTWLRLAQDGDPAKGTLHPHLVDMALAEFEAGRRLNPKIVNLYTMIGWSWLLLAQNAWERGAAPEQYFEKALAVCEDGAQRVSNPRSIYHSLATIHYFRGKFRVREGRDAEADLAQASTYAEQALTIAASAETYIILASAARLQAEREFLTGQAPETNLILAQEALAAVLDINPNHPEAFRSLGRLFTLRARWLMAQGKDPGSAFERARRYLDQALARAPTAPYFLIADARWHIHRAAWRPPEATHAERLRRLAEALRTRSDLPEAQAALACLPRPMEGAAAATAPADRRALLDQALAANPRLGREWAGMSLASRQ